MVHRKKILAVTATLALALAGSACGDDPSSGSGLSEGGAGGTDPGTGGSGGAGGGGTGGVGGSGGGGGSPACTVGSLSQPPCVSCVGAAVLTCPTVAFACLGGGGPLQACAEDAGCLDGQIDVGCILSNCGPELLAVNACMSACPAYVGCFR
ncbi:MAG TPA: hypothetical protein VGD74_09650 [Vulgatibacter sp.]